jgi:murein DD-endopeptidase MepM/ murein hydrolase activator NlpD
MKAVLLYCLICLPLSHLRITSPFGFRKHPVTGTYAFHNGVDFRARSDTVFAIADGITSWTGYDPITGINVWIRHPGYTSSYGHLSRIFVAPGDPVFMGQAIALTGATGRVTGEHLHFSILSGGKYVNPLEFIYQKLINTKNHE